MRSIHQLWGELNQATWVAGDTPKFTPTVLNLKMLVVDMEAVDNQLFLNPPDPYDLVRKLTTLIPLSPTALQVMMFSDSLYYCRPLLKLDDRNLNSS